MFKHGTHYAYTKKKCRCEECRSFVSAARKKHRATNKGTLLAEDPRHGTLTGYTYYSCRCAPCRAANTHAIRMRRYGIERGWVEEELQRLEHKCPGCGSTLTTSSAHVDHDHATGRVRGLLCFGCNIILGNAKDDPVVLYRLAAYLDFQPADD